MKTKDIFMFALTLLLFSAIGIGQTPEDRIKDLGITLSEPGQPVANYVKWRQVGNLLYLAGAGADVYGKLGQELSIEQGYEAARLTAIEIIGTIKAACGDLSKVKQFVKVHGMVNSTPDFYDQPKVINGFSDLIVEVFGEKGKHARAAVGQVALPFNMAVEIEVIVELED